MREIKFQVFTTDWEGVTGCFEGYFLQLLDNGKYKVAFTNSDNDKEFITTERENIRFFTGLKDKNDKEIYEGDIVNVNHYGGTPKYETVRFYTIAGFAGMHPFTDSGYHWASHRCEIAGNIYENPELLEGEKHD